MISIFFIVVVTLALINGKNPTLPNALDKSRFYQSKLDPSNKLTLSTAQNKKYKGFKDLLEKRKTVSNITGNKVSAPLIRSGFYTPWSATSLPDLKRHADKLNTIYPEWFFIDTTTYSLQTRIDSAGLAVMKQNSLSIQPIFNNFHTRRVYDADEGRLKDSGYFDFKLAHIILNNAERRAHIIQQIADTLAHYQLQGLNVDFEELNETGNEPLTQCKGNDSYHGCITR
jgi:spore germination protein YaaH